MFFNSNVPILEPQKYLNRSEIALLPAVLGLDRDSLLIRTAFTSGGRELELSRLTKRDVGLSTPTITYREPAKDSHARTVAISEELATLLLKLPTDHAGRLFPICPRMMRYIWHKKRPETIDKSFKALRHSFAVELYRATKDILMVQRAMGHKSLINTLIYAACVDYEESMQKNQGALDALIKPA